MRTDPSVKFLKSHRDHILHEAPPRVGQIISLGEVPACAAQMYYYETPDIPATATIRNHLDTVAMIVAEAEQTFKLK